MATTSSSFMAAGQSVVARVQEQPLVVLVVTFIIICITTRILTGKNGGRGSQKNSYLHDAKIPPEVPYWIPYLGHIPQMALGSKSFLAGLRKLYPSGVFSLDFLGTTHTVIFKPDLIASLINKPGRVADSESICKRFMYTSFGFPRSGTDKRKLDEIVPDLMLQYDQLMSERKLDQMVDRMVDRLRHDIADFVTFNNSHVDQAEWERIAGAFTAEDASGETVVVVNLFELVRNFIAFSANVSIVGTDFVQNFPQFWQNLWRFDEGFSHLAMDLPAFLPVGKAIQARRARWEAIRCVREFEKALEADRNGEDPGPQWTDLDNVSPLIQERVDDVYRKQDVDIPQRAALDFQLLWAMNANSNSLVFWLLWRIYSDTNLLARIREEIAPYVILEDPAPGFGAAFGSAVRIDRIDVHGLLDQCPLIKAAYVETLRVDVSSWSFRYIREDAIISDKDGSSEKFLLPGGMYAHGAHELHHMNPDAFDNAKEWRIERHIRGDATNDKGKKEPAVDVNPVRPYGDGVSMYKDGQFAVKEILVFSAAILAMYDMQPAGGGPWKLPKQSGFAGTKRPTSSTLVWIKSRAMPPKTA